ncbi:hypothetical protein D8S78_20990 [Natrialba swarupiae]|nr:hypothetical protein [Natrialba swarupiae]
MDRNGNPKTISVGSGLTHSFADDDRAIEGSPIGLVIALIIGVMSLRIMLRILGGVDTFEGTTEVDVEFEDNQVTSSAPWRTRLPVLQIGICACLRHDLFSRPKRPLSRSTRCTDGCVVRKAQDFRDDE